MGNPATEQDLAPKANTIRRYVWQTLAGLRWTRGFWGRRLFGQIGIIGDAFLTAATQAVYARLPGHPQQAPDSMVQAAKDRDLFRYRGETDANWKARVQSHWVDQQSAGTNIQLLTEINRWGNAGWPVTWNNNLVTLVESGDPANWNFTVTIPNGLITPALPLWKWGDGHAWGDTGLYWGIGVSTDLPVLLWIVAKWKRKASKAYVNVYYDVGKYVTFAV